MELSILIAQITAIIYLSAALGALFNQEYYRKILDDFSKNAALTYIIGFITVILGFLMVRYHNIWVKDWPVLITVLGWLALFKGILLIAFPKLIFLQAEFLFRSKCFQFFPYIAIAMGLFFGYFGFIR